MSTKLRKYLIGYKVVRIIPEKIYLVKVSNRKLEEGVKYAQS